MSGGVEGGYCICPAKAGEGGGARRILRRIGRAWWKTWGTREGAGDGKIYVESNPRPSKSWV